MTKFELYFFPFLKAVFRCFKCKSGLGLLKIIENHSKLKLKSDEEDFYIRQQLEIIVLVSLLIFFASLIIIFNIFPYKVSSDKILEIIWATILILIFMSIVLTAWYLLCRLLLSFWQACLYKRNKSTIFPRKLYSLFHLVLLPLTLSDFTTSVFGDDFSCLSNNTLFLLLLLFGLFTSCLFFCYINLITLPPYILEEVNTLPTTISSILSIVAIVVDMYNVFNVDSSTSLSLLSITLSCFCGDLLTRHYIGKYHKKAQTIFESQLLVQENQIKYDELKRCYYFGGSKYKEKLFSTERFIKLINYKEYIRR